MAQIQFDRVESRKASRVYTAFVIAAVIVIFTQKLGISFGASSLMLSLPLILPVLAWLFCYGNARINPVRLALYAAFASAAIVSSLLVGREFSAPSVLLALILYLTWVVEVPVSNETYRRCMRVLAASALIGAALVLVQQVAQLFGYHGWLNLEKVIPQPLLQHGYNYLQPYKYLSLNIKPNGVFFLESSFVSQFVALGLIIELAFFRRIVPVALMGAALLLTYAGTGLIIVAACVPVLLFRLSAKLAGTGLAAFLILGTAAYVTGWYDTIAPRVTEVDQTGSSGYYRYTAPTMAALARLQEPGAILTGDGAGSTFVDTTDPTVYEPILKVLLEYGALSALLYTVFMIYCMFVSTPDKLVSWAFILFLNTGGGYFSAPVCVLACLLGCILLRVEPARSAKPLAIDRSPVATPS